MKDKKTFGGMYRGEVIDVMDPLNAGRVKIRVRGVYDSIPPDGIPWAFYADPLMGGVGITGGFFIPDVGAEVWCFFENEDHMRPVFFAGAPHALGRSDEKASEEGSVYPYNRVFKTKQGHMIEFDDTDGNARIHVFHRTGTEFIMHDNGDIVENVVGDAYRNVKGKVVDTIEGTYDIIVTGDMTVELAANYYTNTQGNVAVATQGNSDTTTVGNVSVETHGTNTQTTVGSTVINHQDTLTVTNTGDVSVTNEANVTTNTTGNVTIETGGDHQETITGASTTSVSGDYTVTGSAKITISSSGDTVITSGGAGTVTSSGIMSIDGSMIMLG